MRGPRDVPSAPLAAPAVRAVAGAPATLAARAGGKGDGDAAAEGATVDDDSEEEGKTVDGEGAMRRGELVWRVGMSGALNGGLGGLGGGCGGGRGGGRR